jgi:hypothetical protein
MHLVSVDTFALPAMAFHTEADKLVDWIWRRSEVVHCQDGEKLPAVSVLLEL